MIVILSFLFKFLFAWRSGITRGWQDELSWFHLARTNSFFDTVATYDSGYPTPLLRGLSYLLSTLVTENFFVWHILVLLLISTSIASLAFSRIMSNRSSIFVAAVIATYPSFDLLLLHNLSYWTFIPILVILTNFFEKERPFGSLQSLRILILITLTAKPQILFALLVLSVTIIFAKKIVKPSFLIVPIFIFVYFVIGRLTSTSIALTVDKYSIMNYFLTISSHVLFVLFPMVALIVYSISRYSQFNLIPFWFLLSNIFISSVAFMRNHRIEKLKLLRLIVLTFVAYSIGLYFFSNSGWSQNDLITSDVYTSLFSRHYLPIVICTGVALVLGLNDHRYVRVVLGLAVTQNLVMQIALFGRLYSPA
jgi:hypothetical protein